jgi:hypothetical protein
MKRIRNARTKPDARHQSARSSSKKLKSPQGDEAPESKPIASGADWLEQFRARLEEKLLAWQNRPTLHPSYFDDTERAAELASNFGSAARFESVKELVAAFQKKPTLENYLRFRRGVPDAELEIESFADIEVMEGLKTDLEKHKIDMNLIYGTLDAFEPDIDELSLRLMELLIARDKLPKSGPGHIDKRRNAISDTFVNYLIAGILEAFESNKRPVLIPTSLIVLVRDRLCGSDPDLHREYLAREKDKELRSKIEDAVVGQKDKKISLRKLASIIGVSKNRVARLLDKPDFQNWLNMLRHHALSIKRSSGKPK